MANSEGGGGDEIYVHLDATIEDMIPDFLEHRRENIRSILDALEAGDYEGVEQIGHDMEGTGGAFGFKGMAQIGRSLKEAALESEAGEVRRLAEELASYLERIRIVYE